MKVYAEVPVEMPCTRCAAQQATTGLAQAYLRGRQRASRQGRRMPTLPSPLGSQLQFLPLLHDRTLFALALPVHHTPLDGGAREVYALQILRLRHGMAHSEAWR